jgi:hypothetical protein
MIASSLLLRAKTGGTRQRQPRCAYTRSESSQDLVKHYPGHPFPAGSVIDLA